MHTRRKGEKSPETEGYGRGKKHGNARGRNYNPSKDVRIVVAVAIWRILKLFVET